MEYFWQPRSSFIQRALCRSRSNTTQLLNIVQLIPNLYRRHVLISHLVPHTPTHIHHLGCWNIKAAETWETLTASASHQEFSKIGKVKHWPDIPVHVSLCNTPWSWGRRTPSTCSSPSTCPWTSSWWRCAPPLKIRGFKKRKNLWILNAFISKENTQQFLKKIPPFS